MKGRFPRFLLCCFSALLLLLCLSAPASGEEGGLSLCRDGFHMSLDYGRYLLALVWLKTLCGADVTRNPWVPQSAVPADEALLRVIREQAERTCAKA